MPASVGLVRDLTQVRLTRWKASHSLVEDALLVVSELSTNAVTATPGGRITVRIDRESTGVLLAVWDASPAVPVRRPTAEPSLAALDLDPARFDDNGGHGLGIITALAHQCGHTPTAPTGKWVWARLRE
ncbi:ATP-binding protein [Actinomadura craniellae]|uniref:ATP-binding protein n=1 Tax=Actinomadura craniellae TaxID=2231787 RepID=UPI001314F220|nr:ATP-binding protein [Actinomadura craniellae]